MQGAKKAVSAERCLLCGRIATTGLSIRGRRICPDCEAKLVQSKAGTPGYEQYVRKLRTLWPGAAADE
jgi:hypothetical protein